MGMVMYAWSLKPKKIEEEDPILKLTKGIYEDYPDITTFAMRAGKATFYELVDQLFEREQIAVWRNHYRLDLWMCEHFASSVKDEAFVNFASAGDGLRMIFGEEFRKALLALAVGFNQQPVMLNVDDIDALEDVISSESQSEDPPEFQGDIFEIEDLQFIKVARSELSKGRILYYDNW